ncbi:MAG: molybdopterin-dependent oxidoreductase [Firmicutes bacterium]|nr:molybdopterin-dependent oxidoreductase [Bacillota bacterium]
MKPRYRGLILMLLAVAALVLAGCAGEKTDPADGATMTIEGGGVESAVQLSLGELKAMTGALVEDDYFSINTYGTEEYFHFKGVWVWALLEQKADLKEDAAAVSFVAEDGYTVTYTLEEVQREDYLDQQDPEKKYKMILAWEENNEPYDISKGNPFRLVNGQREPGDVNKPLWVSQIQKIIVE